MHLQHRDRLAFAFRIVGTLTGFAVIGWAFLTSSWNETWVVALVILVVGGGAVAYHLLTSIVRCPTCGGRVINLRIGEVDSKRKLFPCPRCQTATWLREGFYWQDD